MCEHKAIGQPHTLVSKKKWQTPAFLSDVMNWITIISSNIIFVDFVMRNSYSVGGGFPDNSIASLDMGISSLH